MEVEYVYVVTMYRFGDDELHSYVLGVYDTLLRATRAEEAERLNRGGKYEGQVLIVILQKEEENNRLPRWEGDDTIKVERIYHRIKK